ncbi:MAG: 4-hydroxy-3-methylbut-2-enyl diphosphate reductase [Alphaproteobacteria bacterium]|nr:4-hydroxy-3-methylbut-2-enyl diphosphate reductase [Alphaproteobacteria bacterium]
MSKSPLRILLAKPRGFCAGVDRAIQIVEHALERYGRPIYVRHEIVHNRFVVENLEAKGAIFVDELSEVPDDAKVIFSAHGVPKSVPAETKRRDLFYLDATCPLVSKVHNKAQYQQRNGRHILLIGHEGHPEVVGTMGQVPDGAITLVETVDDVARLDIPNDAPLSYVMQTTLSVDDTAAIVEALRARFPNIAEPSSDDICYATTNRQEAVKVIAKQCEAMIVIGAPNSSNSNRLVEVALRSGCSDAALVERADEMDWTRFEDCQTLGLSAGASAPETLVDEFIEACRNRYDVTIEEVTVHEENVHFNLPRALTE